jgi:hypothetical protein
LFRVNIAQAIAANPNATDIPNPIRDVNTVRAIRKTVKISPALGPSLLDISSLSMMEISSS